MNNLNYCFECNYRYQLPRPVPVPKYLQKIHQANQKINPRWSRFMDQALDQRFKENSHDQ